MRTKGIRLSSEHQAWFYSIFAILFLSGLVWIILTYLVPCPPEDEGCIPSLAPALMKVHGAAAMATMVLFGTLIPIHIKRGWAAKINRPNGAFLITINLLLIVTGYGLYYGGSEGLRFLSHWVHIGLGLFIPFLLLWHIIMGRKKIRKISGRSLPPKEAS